MSRPLRVATGRTVVIDSSVAFKWFDATEQGADIAVGLLREHKRDDTALLAPAHLHLELINTLVCRRVAPEEIERAVRFLADADVLVAAVDDALLVDAARIAHSERIALYDATFIALAARLEAELVTADRRQAATRSCRVRLIG
ncbi:MAG: type II toxin-antitoxin system VapC family toxin [Anaerosomatales bacterium]|nr:type II toxin-antitoxin system VapC family toxin [Anaerosomatales bacterium]MDT8434035.1 type II toxin-antitoxin system VapC family toxin [Anaerosomatales bacterium]